MHLSFWVNIAQINEAYNQSVLKRNTKPVLIKIKQVYKKIKYKIWW